jgi:hypothetical protein
MPMIWQTDAFVLATGFDDAANRYIGLWMRDDKNAAPAATDSLLLVRPDIAMKQRDAEVRTPTDPLTTPRQSIPRPCHRLPGQTSHSRPASTG